jgi:prevent-host-death family protein
MGKWRLDDAKEHFNEVVEKAFSEGPQTISVARGRRVVVTPATRAPRGAKVRPSELRHLSELFAGVPLAEIIPPRSQETVGPGPAFD